MRAFVVVVEVGVWGWLTRAVTVSPRPAGTAEAPASAFLGEVAVAVAVVVVPVWVLRVPEDTERKPAVGSAARAAATRAARSASRSTSREREDLVLARAVARGVDVELVVVVEEEQGGVMFVCRRRGCVMCGAGVCGVSGRGVAAERRCAFVVVCRWARAGARE
jgi:hypothetical protein